MRSLFVFSLLCFSCAPSVPTTGTVGANPTRRPTDPAPLVRALAQETASVRGLPLLREVPVRVESTQQIASHLRAELEADREEFELERKVWVALGMVAPAVDLSALLGGFLGDEAQGYYDPSERVLVLTEHEANLLDVAGPGGLDARATVVHELTHALQHQHFENTVDEEAGRGPPPLSDEARARLMLLEGDATVVAMEWAARRRGGQMLGTPELVSRLVRWADGAQILTERAVPGYLLESAELPYEAGAIAVGMLHQAGGWNRVNEALRTRSLRAALLLHPERSEASLRAPAQVQDPALQSLGARVLVDRSFGELELRLLLSQSMRSERAQTLAATWRGDQFLLYEHQGQLAFRWNISCDNAQDAAALVQALQPQRERWIRLGCGGMLSTANACRTSVQADGAVLRLARGG